MDSLKLDYLAKRKGYTSSKMADALGIDESTYSRKKSGKSDFTRNEIRIIIDTLGLTAKEACEIFFNLNIA